MVIRSLENEKVKNLIKLQRKKYRDLTGTYLVEGRHIVEEAYRAGVLLEVYLLEGEEYSYDVDSYSVSLDVMKKISMMDTPSSIVGVCKKIENTEIVGDRILLLDEIQDPGNLGTIIRSAVAFDVDMILLSEDSVDLYNPKVLRATQGILFHIPIVRMDSVSVIDKLKNKGYILYGTNVVNGVEVSSLTLEEKRRWCLIMGNEGKGLKREIQDLCDKNLYIPMNSNVESLNVGVACSILLYEFRR